MANSAILAILAILPFLPLFRSFHPFWILRSKYPEIAHVMDFIPFGHVSFWTPFGPHFGGLKRPSQSGPWGASPGLTPFGPLLDLFEVRFTGLHAVWLTHGSWVRGPSLDLFWSLSLQSETSCFDMSGVQNARVALLGWPVLPTSGTCVFQIWPIPF